MTDRSDLTPEEQARYDEQKAEYERHTAESLRKGLCPDSGLRLHKDGNCAAVSDLSCDVCDCFGYARSEVG